jgi:hypothetical protein
MKKNNIQNWDYYNSLIIDKDLIEKNINLCKKNIMIFGTDNKEKCQLSAFKTLLKIYKQKLSDINKNIIDFQLHKDTVAKE